MTGRERLYNLGGLGVRCRVDLPLAKREASEWDVDVRWVEPMGATSEPPAGDVVAQLGNDEGAWYTATATPEGHCLRFNKCGDFMISQDLREVVVRPHEHGESGLLPILLCGTVSAFLLALRGETVLHASAVSIEGRVMTFVGHSGGGKSTLAALMCRGGAELVSDDLLIVRSGTPSTCHGTSTELRLRAPAAAAVEHLADAATRTTVDDRLAWAPTAAPSGSLPLAAIVLPIPSRRAAVLESRLVPPSDALLALLSVPRIHGWTRSDVLTRDFSVLSELVNEVPVHEVLVPWGPPYRPEISPSLAALIRC